MRPTAYWTSFLRLSLFLITLAILMAPITTTAQKPDQIPSPSPTPTASPSSSARPTPSPLLEVAPAKPVTPKSVEEQQKNKDDDIVRIRIDLVTLNASVVDTDDRRALGLTQKHFKVFDEYRDEHGKKVKPEQKIAFFNTADSPTDILIFLDLSGSMSGDKYDNAKEALAKFLATCNELDHIAIIGCFDDKPVLIKDFFENRKEGIPGIMSDLIFTQTKGQTPFFDTLHIGINKLEEHNRKNHKKNEDDPGWKQAMIIISDGQDNHSRYTLGEIKRDLKETGIIVYSIVIPPSVGRDMDQDDLDGQNIMTELAEMTGGKVYDRLDFPLSQQFPEFPIPLNPRPLMKLDDVMENIANELRTQYTIGYYPTGRAHDGQWHKISIKVTPPKGWPRLIVKTKDGYYAPKD